MPLLGAHVVDGLHQAGPIGGEGVAGQGARVVEAEVTRRIVQRDVHQMAAAIQIRIAVLVVADPARAVGGAQGGRRAAIRAAVQQIAAAMP
ncbi:hypothetical protein D3C72_2139110 [compost metagenome]